jgi:hypothetical protein
LARVERNDLLFDQLNHLSNLTLGLLHFW